MKAKILLPIFSIIAVTVFFPAGNANAGKNTLIAAQQTNRLREYDYLINFYSQIPFYPEDPQVDPDFIRALILAESNGDPEAVSNKHALGLGQIIYTTAQEAVEELLQKKISFHYLSRDRLEKFTRQDLFNPKINILITCYLIAKYNHQHQGRLDLVVSAWNAGEHSIKNNQPAPYRETQNHITKVNDYFVSLLNSKNENR